MTMLLTITNSRKQSDREVLGRFFGPSAKEPMRSEQSRYSKIESHPNRTLSF
jgi:hypothetical protein